MAKLSLGNSAKETINYINDEKNTPLHIACDKNNLEMVILLLNNGASNSLKCRNYKIHTPLAIADIYHYDEIKNFIMKKFKI